MESTSTKDSACCAEVKHNDWSHVVPKKVLRKAEYGWNVRLLVDKKWRIGISRDTKVTVEIDENTESRVPRKHIYGSRITFDGSTDDGDCPTGTAVH